MNSSQDLKINLKFHIIPIEFGTPEYCESISLRTKILRIPLGLQFDVKKLADEYDSIHLGCYTTNYELIACLVLEKINNDNVKMRQVAVDTAFQGKGVGSKLVTESERIVKELGFTKIVCHARESAVPFYLKLNYNIVGKKFIEVGIPHFKMVKKV
jgi:predicted GNAT family N-acyltransferase